MDLAPSILIDLLSGGGVLGFAYLVLRLLEKLGEDFQKLVEERDKNYLELLEQVRKEAQAHEQVQAQLIEFYREDLRTHQSQAVQTQDLLLRLTESMTSIGDSLASLVREDGDGLRIRTSSLRERGEPDRRSGGSSGS